jgi:hypothetical protein
MQHGWPSQITGTRFDRSNVVESERARDYRYHSTPRTFDLTKAAYAVGEALDLLSIGRTSPYAAVSRDRGRKPARFE